MKYGNISEKYEENGKESVVVQKCSGGNLP